MAPARPSLRHCESRLLAIYILYLLFRFAHFLLEVPTVRMIENALCHQHVESSSVPSVPAAAAFDESMCKGAAVQDKLANILGWKLSLDALPGLLTTVYYGHLADVYGHYKVLAFTCGGYILSIVWLTVVCYHYNTLPASYALISSAFLFIGGGQFTYASVAVAYIARATQAASRSRYLFFFAAMPHIDKVAAPWLSTIMMARGLFLPSLTSVALAVICLLSFVFSNIVLGDSESARHKNAQPLSEPLLQHVGQPETDVQSSPVQFGDTVNEASSEDRGRALSASVSRTPLSGSLSTLNHWLHDSPPVIYVLVGFFLKSNAMAGEAFVFQYLSEKFHWPLAHTTILRFALSAGAVLTTLIMAPFASSIMTRRGVSAQRINLFIVRLSLLLLTICFIVAWQASTAIVFILSMLMAGFCETLEPAMQGLLSLLADVKHSGQLFGFAYMFALLGDMTGGPIMALLMAIGRSPTRPSAGYCFLGSSAIFGVMGVTSFASRALRTEERRHGAE